MGCLKSGCGCWSYNYLNGSLGNCFNKLTTAYNCSSCGGNCAAQPNDCKDHLRHQEVSEKTGWLRRYRAFAAGEEQSSDCRKTSPKEYWYDMNKNVIMALGRIVGLHADVVFEFLYTLTMQNFSRVLNPRGHTWNSCHVPLSNFDTCDYYMGIFDSKGNVRKPFHPESLLKLLAIMQSVLKEDQDADNGAHKSLFGTSKRSGEKAACLKGTWKCRTKGGNLTGIGPDSLARENGLRRRYQLYEKYRLDGLKGDPLVLRGDTWADYKKTFADAFGPFAGNFAPCGKDCEHSNDPYGNKGDSGDKGHKKHSQFGLDGAAGDESGHFNRYKHVELHSHDDKDESAFDLNLLTHDSLHKGLAGASVRGKHLKSLMKHVHSKIGTEQHFDRFVSAVKNLNLTNASKSDKAISKNLIKRISSEYNDVATGKERDLSKDLTEILMRDLTAKEHAKAKPQKKHGEHFYYGAQVPVLVHEPFDPNNPSSWIRRHPGVPRMDEKGNLVDKGVIHRYMRQSVAQELEKARLRYSIRTAYSLHSNVSTSSAIGAKKVKSSHSKRQTKKSIKKY